MSIPEHKKCVALHKRLRHNHQKGNWRRVRAIRRKNGEIKLKMRIRQMLKVEFEMQKSRIRKKIRGKLSSLQYNNKRRVL